MQVNTHASAHASDPHLHPDVQTLSMNFPSDRNPSCSEKDVLCPCPGTPEISSSVWLLTEHRYPSTCIRLERGGQEVRERGRCSLMLCSCFPWAFVFTLFVITSTVSHKLKLKIRYRRSSITFRRLWGGTMTHQAKRETPHAFWGTQKWWKGSWGRLQRNF